MRPGHAIKKILVTGGAGYIGSVLVPELLRRGHTVTVVDSFRYAQTSLLDCCHEAALTLVRGDVRDERLMRGLLAGADVILPLACLVGAPLCDRLPDEARAVNFEAVTRLAESASRDQAFIFPTTNSGYGVGESGAFCTETSPLRPVSLYGRLKVELEACLLARGNAVSLRLATAFGISPRMRLDLLVNDFTYRAVTDRFIVLFESHFKRNFIHVRDVARAFLLALDRYDRMRGEAYNVGLSDANLSKLELCREIQKQVPDFTILEAPVGKDPDQRDYVVSNAKIEAAGFAPEWTLARGIAELVKGFQVVRRSQFGNV